MREHKRIKDFRKFKFFHFNFGKNVFLDTKPIFCLKLRKFCSVRPESKLQSLFYVALFFFTSFLDSVRRESTSSNFEFIVQNTISEQYGKRYVFSLIFWSCEIHQRRGHFSLNEVTHSLARWFKGSCLRPGLSCCSF